MKNNAECQGSHSGAAFNPALFLIFREEISPEEDEWEEAAHEGVHCQAAAVGHLENGERVLRVCTGTVPVCQGARRQGEGRRAVPAGTKLLLREDLPQELESGNGQYWERCGRGKDGPKTKSCGSLWTIRLWLSARPGEATWSSEATAFSAAALAIFYFHVRDLLQWLRRSLNSLKCDVPSRKPVWAPASKVAPLLKESFYFLALYCLCLIVF